ncbi:MAG TPA: class I SAM-dependent methyltransferase [Anaerolineales bacterium]|nr:class I SAM-dependent methyltransferase [Anaerolineales bacterium]
MSRFGSDPREFFEFVYSDVPPWDIGGPQPALSTLFSEFPPADPILDVGCGSGDLAIHLARLGHRVTGVDFVETAITQAQQKAARLPAELTRLLDFQIADALQPSLLGRQFGSVVDSGFYHLFDPDQGQRFLDDVAKSLLPGGRYYLLAFAIDFSLPNLPRGVSEQELRARFTSEKGWKILDLRPAEFLSRVAPPVAAVRACVERMPT